MESATKACQGWTQSQRAAATRWGMADWMAWKSMENHGTGKTYRKAIFYMRLFPGNMFCVFFGTPEDFDSSSWYLACELQVCGDLTRDNCGYARMDIPQNGWWRLRKSPMFLKAQFSFVKFPLSSLKCPDIHRLNSHPHLLNIGISRVCCLLYCPAGPAATPAAAQPLVQATHAAQAAQGAQAAQARAPAIAHAASISSVATTAEMGEGRPCRANFNIVISQSINLSTYLPT